MQAQTLFNTLPFQIAIHQQNRLIICFSKGKSQINGETINKLTGGHIVIVIIALFFHLGAIIYSIFKEWKEYTIQGEKSLWREYVEELRLVLVPQSVNISESCEANGTCLYQTVLQQRHTGSSNQTSANLD